MGLPIPPHPEGELPMIYAGACEDRRCRPRLVHTFGSEVGRDRWADLHERHQPHQVTRTTFRSRLAPDNA